MQVAFSEGSLTQQIQRLEQVLEATRMYSFTEDGSPRPPSFAQCVKRAVFLFHDLFFCQIKHLLSSFPLDHRTTSGMLFWSPPKRAPTAIEFDASQPLHREFVVAAANLFAFAYVRGFIVCERSCGIWSMKTKWLVHIGVQQCLCYSGYSGRTR